MNENRGRVGYEATFEKDDYSRIPWERCCEDVKKYWNTVYCLFLI